MALSAVGGIRPDVYVGFEGLSNDWVRPVYGSPAATPATRGTPVNGRDQSILEGETTTRDPCEPVLKHTIVESPEPVA